MKRTAVKELLKYGAVAVNGEVVRQFDHPLAAGDQIVVSDLKSASAARRLSHAKIEILHEDDALLAVEKPVGLLTVATDREKLDTLFVRLKEFLAARDGRAACRPQVVHRLDQDTSGIVLLAKSPAIRDAVQKAWDQVEKTYAAIVVGAPPEPQGSITTWLTETKGLAVANSFEPVEGAKEATTHYRLVATREKLSLVELVLETGRKHQLRVHLARLGCPVAGDSRYGERADPCGRLALHATRLRLNHPVTGEPLEIHSPLPRAMARFFPGQLQAGSL